MGSVSAYHHSSHQNVNLYNNFQVLYPRASYLVNQEFGIYFLQFWLGNFKLNLETPMFFLMVFRLEKYSLFGLYCGSGSGRIRSFMVTRIRIQIRENTRSGSGSFIHRKTPCNTNFLVWLKYSFVQMIFYLRLVFLEKFLKNFITLPSHPEVKRR